MKPSRRPGALALIAIIFITAFALAVMISISQSAYRGFSGVSSAKTGDQTLAAAEAGIQDVSYRLGSNINLASYSTTFNGTPVDIAITGTGFPKTVTSTATGANNTVRKIQITIHASNGGVLGGAILTGTGGFSLGNNSTITGDICANGNITGQSNSSITGNVQLASGATITGVTVTGTTTPNQSCTFPPFPAYFFTKNTSDPQYAGSFYKLASDGGSQGTTNITGTATKLGPKVITGNLTFTNNSTLTLTGPVWVTGTISTANGVTVAMDTTAGTFAAGASTALVAEQSINADNNNVSFTAIPAQKSYLMVASVTSDITVKNGSTAVVYYAPVGTFTDKNNCASGTCLNNATAKTVVLGNNVNAVYDAGLQDLIFPNNPFLRVNPAASSWTEL